MNLEDHIAYGIDLGYPPCCVFEWCLDWQLSGGRGMMARDRGFIFKGIRENGEAKLWVPCTRHVGVRDWHPFGTPVQSLHEHRHGKWLSTRDLLPLRRLGHDGELALAT